MAVLVQSRMYTIAQVIVNPGAVTNLNIQANATRPFVIVRARIEAAQAALPTAAGARVRFVRKTAAPTATAIAATTFLNHDPADMDSTVTASHTATAEGTDADFADFGWRTDVGFDWAPTPEEYIVIPGGATNGFGIKHVVAPPAGTYMFAVTIHEVG